MARMVLHQDWRRGRTLLDMPNARHPAVLTGASKYVALTSYRRDGKPVATPVWVVSDDDALAVWTTRDSFKVKRIRRNPSVTVAPCAFRGQLLGPEVQGVAEILDASGTERIRAAIRRKYGPIGWVTVFMSRLRRGREGTVGIRIVLTPEEK